MRFQSRGWRRRRPVQPHPEQVLGVGGVGDHRPAHLDGEVEARRGQAVGGIQVIVIVDDVDAAHIGDLPVDHADLAMQAPQAAARRDQLGEPARLGPEDAALGAGVGEPDADLVGGGAAETVQHHSHLDAAQRGFGQAPQHHLAAAVQHEDIGFQVHADRGGIDGGAQGREEVRAILQQPDVVAVRPVQPDRLALHGSSSSASSGE